MLFTTDTPQAPDTTDTRCGVRREVFAGALAMAPFVVGYAPFALIVGSILGESTHTGPGLAATWLLYGGSVHLAVLRLFEEGAGLAAIVLTGLLVNLRLLLYSATLAPLWRDQRPGFLAVAGALLVEPSWSLAQARHERPGSARDRRVHYLAAALTLWVCWSGLVLVGMLAGARLSNVPSVDLAVPICLLAVVTPSLRQRPGAAAAASGAAVAVVARGLPAGTSVLLAVGAGLVAAHLADRGTS